MFMIAGDRKKERKERGRIEKRERRDCRTVPGTARWQPLLLLPLPLSLSPSNTQIN
jgi:3'-phosphoadenosine 5'-phosphosulfate sulfotransferase (PAPS reductase)/FAD synthetase